MRQNYVVFDTDGNVREGGSNSRLPEGAIIVGSEFEAHEMSRLFVDDSNGLALRPQSPIPVITGSSVTLGNCPTDTRLQITDVIGDEVIFDQLVAGNCSFDFADAGDYFILVESPWPYLSTEARMVV